MHKFKVQFDTDDGEFMVYEEHVYHNMNLIKPSKKGIFQFGNVSITFGRNAASFTFTNGKTVLKFYDDGWVEYKGTRVRENGKGLVLGGNTTFIYIPMSSHLAA